MGRIETLEEFKDVTELATKFLICGTLSAKLPYQKVYDVREKNRRLGLSLMGIHEWLIKRGERYEVTPELHRWLRPISLAVIILPSVMLMLLVFLFLWLFGLLLQLGVLVSWLERPQVSSQSSLSPSKRRYLKNGTEWHYQYVVDSAAQELIDLYGTSPDKIESALDLASDPERRIKFQADVQDYVDQSISSTINLPAWNSQLNNPDTVDDFANLLVKYAHRLRGFTCYADGSREVSH